MHVGTVLAGTGAALLLTVTVAAAGPCDTGPRDPHRTTSNANPSTASKVTPGTRAETTGSLGGTQEGGGKTAMPGDTSKMSPQDQASAQRPNDC
ncbi:hypothetical protein [Methylobacterium tarhaniae]|uniref:hypothetical protein n=1 Tax=Methylobacterium tarhaniae TaxID=1187852 RepID=UPI000AA1BE6C|nr:hypothetical protein [Methylobacterium tarhaniae]